MAYVKEEKIERIVDLLEGSYTRESAVLQTVEKAIRKLSLNELSSLYSVLLTRVAVRKV